jgi:uncharacterized protein (TIGR02246 family)
MQLDTGSSRQLGKLNTSALFSTIIRIVFLCLLLPACSQKDTLPEGVTSAFEIAFTKHDLEGCLAVFTDDAQILPQHGPVISGREQITAYLKSTMTPVVSFNTDTDMVLVRDDVAVEQGHFTIRNIRRGTDIELGKYMHVWRKVAGQWRLYRVMFNTDVAPKVEVTVEPEPENGAVQLNKGNPDSAH